MCHKHHVPWIISEAHAIGLLNPPNFFTLFCRSQDRVSVILFSADWAEQCGQVLDVLNALAAKPELANSLQFLNVAAEELSEVSLKCQIEAVPTVLFTRDGKAIDRIDGVDIAALTAKCQSFAGVVEVTKDNIDDRLKELINRSDLMVFMKGDRDMPRCGFSKTLIAILNETGLTYDTFDILSDENVRQRLKTYSDWPTYPQVYVKGTLIGGLDIIKELKEGNELVAALKGE